VRNLQVLEKAQEREAADIEHKGEGEEEVELELV